MLYAGTIWSEALSVRTTRGKPYSVNSLSAIRQISGFGTGIDKDNTD